MKSYDVKADMQILLISMEENMADLTQDFKFIKIAIYNKISF